MHIARDVLGRLARDGTLAASFDHIAGEHLTGAQIASALTRALGKEMMYNAVPPEVYRGFGFPGAEDLGNMFQFNRDFAQAFCGARNPDVARALNPSLQTFDVWLAENKGRIPLE